MPDILSPTTAAFALITLAAFAWIVRLGMQVRHGVHKHSQHLHDRIDDLEASALKLRKDMDGLSVDLNDKIDAQYLEKRVDGLVELIKAER
ncbi:hypothetical protein HY995_03425 [Candidatus Micrarchaeota archaeon]|nr:hypothetical protein [Candidatus Micrarchaeota archaeon]MBI5177111.1 hypothetical protein [Candidatus Micrarchaeota archaeon]